MVLFVAIALVVLAAFAGVRSLRRRVLDAAPPRPPLSTRGWIVAGAAMATLAAQFVTWLPLRPTIPTSASVGSVLYGGPGDGLWLLFVVLLWVCMQPIHVLLAFFCARSVKQAALIASLLIVASTATAALGVSLTECPAGFVCTGG